MSRFHKVASTEARKEKCRVNWNIPNFSEIRDSKEAVETQIHRFEMGFSIKRPVKFKCYLTCDRVYGRMWINPNVALDEELSGDATELFATLQVEVNEGSVFRSDTSPLCNVQESMSHSPFLPQVYLPFEAEFRNYVNADGSLYLNLIVNLYHFEETSTRPSSPVLYCLEFDCQQKFVEKLQHDLEKLCKNPDTISQDLAMRKMVSSDDQEFFLNPEILRVRCPVLYSMCEEETSSVLKLPDISGQDLGTILRFVHTAEVPVGVVNSTGSIDGLVCCAKRFELNDLAEYLEESRMFPVIS